VQLRLAVQRAIKRVFGSMGLSVRYAHQHPNITDPRIYSRWMAAPNVRCIFDVGANVGGMAQRFARSFPNATVYSFEPFSAAYRRLKEVADASAGQIKVQQVACGDEEGTLEVELRFASTALYKLPRDRSVGHAVSGGVPRSWPTERITVVRLDRICAEQSIARIDIFKTDTEGYDAKVLAGAQEMLSNGRIRCVVAEIGFLDDPQHTDFTSVFTYLRQFGFELVGLYDVAYNFNLECCSADAIFINRATGNGGGRA